MLRPGATTEPSDVTLRERLLDLLPTRDPSLFVDPLVAVLLVILGWYLSKLLVRIAGRPVAKRFTRPSVANTLLQGIRVGVLLLAIGAALNRLGVEAGELFLSGAVFAAVLAVVLAPIVGSFVSGLFVLADQPFEVGDMIELVDQGTRGYVDDITLRYTKLFTLDNTFIVVPNSMIRDRDIINYSAEDARIRQSIEIVLTYEGDLDEGRRLIERSARAVDDVIKGGPAIRVGTTRYPAAPTTYISEFGDHGVHLVLRYWVRNPFRLQAVRSAVHTNVWDAIAEADVEIAYPHSHLVFDETSGRADVAVSTAQDRDGPAHGSNSPNGPPTGSGHPPESTDPSTQDPDSSRDE